MSAGSGDLAGLIDGIYEAGLEPQAWSGIMTAIRDRLKGTGAALHVSHTSGRGFSFGATVELDPEALSAYANYYHAINPLNQKLLHVPAGRTVLSQELVPTSEYRKSQFYSDFTQPFGICCSVTSVLQRTPQYVASFGVTSGVLDVFSPADSAFLASLAPHLTRAIEINRRLQTVTADGNGALAALDLLVLPVLIVAADARLQHANPAGEALIRQGRGLMLVRGRLGVKDAGENAVLARLISDATTARGTRGGTMTISLPPPSRPLSVMVQPLPQPGSWLSTSNTGAAIFIADPEAAPMEPISAVLRAYGLTNAEAQMVTALTEGKSPEEAAARFGISIATARNHINRALAKTNTHRQAELVRVVLLSRPHVRD